MVRVPERDAGIALLKGDRIGDSEDDQLGWRVGFPDFGALHLLALDHDGDFFEHTCVCGPVIVRICGCIDWTRRFTVVRVFDNGLLRMEPIVSDLVLWNGIAVSTNTKKNVA